jgi:acyl-CoA thioesterase-1
MSVLTAGCAGDTPAPDQPITSERSPERAESSRRYRVVFLGNSITAGYGIDPKNAFPALIQERADEIGLPVDMINAGVSGETTAGGLRRIDWLLRQQVDVLVIELGANDGLRGLPVGGTKANLRQIIDRTREVYPEAAIVLAGMQIPPNLGPLYARRFRNIFPDLAEEQDTELIPFVLDGVAGIDRLNQPDGVHPTAAGHRIIAETVWEILYPILITKTSAGGA